MKALFILFALLVSLSIKAQHFSYELSIKSYQTKQEILACNFYFIYEGREVLVHWLADGLKFNTTTKFKSDPDMIVEWGNQSFHIKNVDHNFLNTSRIFIELDQNPNDSCVYIRYNVGDSIAIQNADCGSHNKMTVVKTSDIAHIDSMLVRENQRKERTKHEIKLNMSGTPADRE